MEQLLLTATQISTFAGNRLLTRATGFFFARGERLFLVTSRHVLLDEPSAHFPDRIELELHVDERNLTRSASWSVDLYANRTAIWRQGSDSGGDIDVAAIALDPATKPVSAVLRAFGPEHLQVSLDDIEIGAQLLIVGFPLGFHDTLHHLPVARQAAVASAFGVRFQGQGTFLTDARTHRGTSGAPVVARAPPSAEGQADLPWTLLGVHSARLDMRTRDQEDETLGLNLAWYADILMTLTDDRGDAASARAEAPASQTPPGSVPPA
jgi:Trypsin-like peptidase domain